MGIALGWVAFALAGVGAAPLAERGQAQLTYNVRVVEVDGVDWRETVYTRLKPVTRQGSATVWTVPRETATRLLATLAKKPATKILAAPKVTALSGVPATIQHRQNHPLVTQVAWYGAEPAHEAAPEKLRVGWHTTMIGRKLDQGVLVRVVFEDTVIRAVHRVNVSGAGEPKCAAAVSPMTVIPQGVRGLGLYGSACPPDPTCPLDPAPEGVMAKKVLDLLEASERLRQAGEEWERFWLADQSAHMSAYRVHGGIDTQVGPRPSPGAPARVAQNRPAPSATMTPKAETANEERCTAADSCCQPAKNERDDDDTKKAFVEVPEVDTQEVAGEWLIGRGEVLLISFGAHTVAGKDGQAVVKERLAIIEADDTPPTVRVIAFPAHVPLMDNNVPFIATSKPMMPAFGLRPPVMPFPAVPIPAMPSPTMPSRSIPQGVHADGTPADLPPLPADETDSDSASSESSEPMASPQIKKIPPPRPATAPAPKPATDSGTNKVEFTFPKTVTTFLPSLFMPGTPGGLQFLLPVKPLSLKLPFGQRLEVEVLGRVVPDPEPH